MLSRRDVLTIVLVIGLVQCIVFAPFLFFGKTLMSSAKQVPSIYPTGTMGPSASEPILRLVDAGAPGWQSEPWLMMLHRQVFDSHVLPMWDPDDAYGKPFAANMQSQPFFPPNFIAAIAPSPASYSWYIVFRLFVAGVFTALFVRLWAGLIPAIGAGLAEAFTGYFMLYYSMPHLSVETLVPALVFCIEIFVRRPSCRSLAALAAATGLIYLGGMPESAALALTLGGAYFLFRIAIDLRGLRATALTIGGFVGANALGAALAAIMLVPFAEYAADSFDTHQLQNVGGALAGAGVDGYQSQALLIEMMPLALGPPWNNIALGFSQFTAARGAVGLIPVFLSLLAIAVLVRRRLRWSARDWLTAFFALSATFCLAKRFGLPFAQWFGYLPVYRIIGMVKYLEPITAFCVAVLCGFGIAVLLEGKVRAKHVVATALLLLWAITAFYLNSAIADVSDTTPHNAYLRYAMTLGAIAFTALCVLCGLAVAQPRRRTAFVIAIVAVLAVELPLEYLVPMNYVATHPDSAANNPYTGAPYIDFLRRNTAADFMRVDATSGWLFPNWAAASQLHDVRSLDGMYVREYLKFIDAFLAPVVPKSDDLFDRFSGTSAIDYSTPLAGRWLSMSSVRYIISPNGIVPVSRDRTLSDLWKQNAASIPVDRSSAVRLAQYSIGNNGEHVLFEHPPYDGVVYHTPVTSDHRFFVADIALAPDVYERPICGAGARFTLTATSSGRQIAQAIRYIDPKHRLAERRWIPLAVDLRSAIGKAVDIRFATAPGPAGDLCDDWAIWGQPRFSATGALRPYTTSGAGYHFRDFAVDGVPIKEFSAPFPRARLVHRVEYEPDTERALKRLTAADFDPRVTAVVTGAPALQVDRPAVAGESARIVSQLPDRVIVDADVRASGVLLLNDTFYRGWRASVDGVPTPIFRTDYLFRGIQIQPGRHRITYTYASGAVQLGLILSLSGLAAICMLLAMSDKWWQQIRGATVQRSSRIQRAGSKP